MNSKMKMKMWRLLSLRKIKEGAYLIKKKEEFEIKVGAAKREWRFEKE